ncbi:replication protein A 70 kDa DNA-binding subunit B-like [Phoenix dactylifera]|uniref:Replication protein A 70 kDa DNA-binding subunit B-like n=1 Tax=Phoenix dactylifera TaxID=42345 RepID=A0A8B7CRH9_PHODC|nr:replication protein A 70 kDa DNA-binding subunit B-like [Phoenix dactylifera]
MEQEKRDFFTTRRRSDRLHPIAKGRSRSPSPSPSPFRAMAFWGVEVKPGNHYMHLLNDFQGRLRICQATLGSGSAVTKSVLQCIVGNRSPILLCSLIPNVVETCHLELEFEEDGKVIFSVLGERSVHLSGYFLRPKILMGGDESDSYGEDIGEEDSSSYDKYESEFIDDGDDDFRCQPVVKSKSSMELENEEKDGFPISFFRRKKISAKTADGNSKLGDSTIHGLLESEEEDGNSKPAEGNAETGAAAVDEEKKRKINAISEGLESARVTFQPCDSSLLPSEMRFENNGIPKKKKKVKDGEPLEMISNGERVRGDPEQENDLLVEMLASTFSATGGGICKLLDKADVVFVEDIVVQVLDLNKVIDLDSVHDMVSEYLFTASDGSTELKAMLPAHAEVRSGMLENLCLIRIFDYTLDARTLIVRSCDVVAPSTKMEIKIDEPHGSSIPATRTFMTRRIFALDSLDATKTDWEIELQVKQKGDLRSYNNSKGNGFVFDVTLADKKDKKIRAVMFNKAARKFYPKFKLGKTYYISGGTLKPTKEQYKIADNDYEIILGEGTIVKEVDDNDSTPKAKSNFDKIDQGNVTSIEVPLSKITNDPTRGQEKAVYFNVKVFVTYISSNQTMWFWACKTCHKKVTETVDSGYWCEKCNAIVQCCLRYVMEVKISDHSGDAWVTVFNEVAEELIGCTAEELARIKASEGYDKYQLKLEKATGTQHFFRVGVQQAEFMNKKRQKITVLAQVPADC